MNPTASVRIVKSPAPVKEKVAKMPKPAPHVRQIRYLDSNGTVLYQANAGKGALIRGATREENGDITIPNCTTRIADDGIMEVVIPFIPKPKPAKKAKTPVFYVNLDGTKEEKGRGKSKVGYVKGSDGNYHQVVQTATTETATPETVNA